MEIYIPKKKEIKKATSEAVSYFWKMREQQKKGQVEQSEGNRGSVLGGKHLDGFFNLIINVLVNNGVEPSDIYTSKQLELPGFFRPTKKWDLLVIKKISKEERRLVCALEMKSQVGSFGNNFNNRTEESLGSSVDFWTAYRENAFHSIPRPWLGYLLLLEDSEGSRNKVSTMEPHFKVFDEFKNTSYAERYEIFARKLVSEGKYTSACLIKSEKSSGLKKGEYQEPAKDLSVKQFITSLAAHLVAAYHS